MNGSVTRVVAIIAVLVVIIFVLKRRLGMRAGGAAATSRSGLSARRRALVPLLFSAMMLTVAVVAIRPTAALQFSGLRAAGTVTALRLNSSGFRSAYDPLIRFKTPNGDIVEFEGTGANPPDRRVGDIVDVMYDADRPTHAVINRGVWSWLIPALFGLCALPIAFLSVRALLRARREELKV